MENMSERVLEVDDCKGRDRHDPRVVEDHILAVSTPRGVRAVCSCSKSSGCFPCLGWLGTVRRRFSKVPW